MEIPSFTANTPKHRAWVSPEWCFFTAPAGTQARERKKKKQELAGRCLVWFLETLFVAQGISSA